MITIEINTDNAAFDDQPGFEIARILRNLAEGLDGADTTNEMFNLYDINGNKVGHFTNK